MSNFDFDKFKKQRELQEPAETTKMAVLGVLMASVILFSVMGEQTVHHIIWYWATLMTLLVIGCAVQDILIARKVKQL